jgi:hypothetical protein
MVYWWVGLVLIHIVADLVNGKMTNKVMYFDREPRWDYVTKFGISVGTGRLMVQARFQRPFLVPGTEVPSDQYFNLSLNVYTDLKWAHALDESECEVKAAFSIFSQNVSIPANGSWSAPVGRLLSQKTRPFVWFAAASDCSRTFHLPGQNMPGVEIQAHFSGSDGGEFSHEEIGLFTIHSIALAVYVGILGYCVYAYKKEMKLTERMDSPILLLLIAILL